MVEARKKGHAVCVPYPAQGHIAPMLKLAKFIHSKGFHITFVNTEYNHARFRSSQGHTALYGADDFRFETIPDGLPPSDDHNRTQDIAALCDSTAKHCLPHFRQLLQRLNQQAPRVSCIVSSGFMTFTLDAAAEIGVPDVLLWTTSACGFMGYLHYKELVDRGIVPLKDASDLSNGYLNTPIDWVPGMNNLRLRDFPSFVQSLDPNDILFNFTGNQAQQASRSSAIVINTFEELERPVLDAMRSMLPPPIYTIGPLPLLSRHIPESAACSLSSNLWKEDTTCISWLDGKTPASVLYVNFGSITVMTREQLLEFAWGLANSEHEFLWVVRSDLVKGESALLPPELLDEVKARGLLASWCPQEEVLAHPAVGGFLTHCGWNSTIESISSGVPMIGWPFFAEQTTNCRYVCGEWGIGMEVGGDAKREEVERVVRELMGGEKGRAMRRMAMEWKEKAVRAAASGGASWSNFERMVEEVLVSNN